MAAIADLRGAMVEDWPTVAGEWRYLYLAARPDEGPSALQFACPCGCGDVGTIDLQPVKPNGWTLSGFPAMPTLDPSILKVGRCRWHGYLRDGVWQTLPDSRPAAVPA